jgi:beta-lactamase regulating signal transducer with metallopeptidase domain/protocatechuate 3,4-dioxygenase beta subunit
MSFLIAWSAKTSLIFGISLIAIHLLRRRSAALRHSLLSAAAICSAGIPLLNLVLPVLDLPIGYSIAGQMPQQPDQASVRTAKAAEPGNQKTENVTLQHGTNEDLRSGVVTPESAGTAANVPYLPSSRREHPVSSESPVPPGFVLSPAPKNLPALRDWAGALFIVWLAGAGAGLIVLLSGIVRLRRIAFRSSTLTDPKWEDASRSLTASLRLRRPVRLLESHHRSVLATWGMIWPQVLLPSGASSWSDERIKVVLAHEMAHIRRGDWLIQMLAAMVCAFHWFNPLVWIGCRRLNRESENACDDVVLGGGITGFDYAAHLLHLIRTLHAERNWLPAQMMARSDTLEQRLRRMLDPQIRRSCSRISKTLSVSFVMVMALTLTMLHVHARGVAMLHAPGAVPVTPPAILAAEAVPFTPEPAVVQADGPASVEGVVVRFGSSEPVSGAEVELTRVEGTAAVPLLLSVGNGPGGVDVNVQSLFPNATLAAQQIIAMQVAADQANSALAGIGEVLPHVRTSSDGHFAFRDLKPGKYRLAAAMPNGTYNPVEYGQRDPKGRGVVFDIADHQVMRDSKLEMMPVSTIAGRILDENGDPMGHVSVVALAPSYQDGNRNLKIVQAALTNASGDYRLFWLRPGRYYVAAKVEDPDRRSIPIAISSPGAVVSMERQSMPVITRRVLPTGDVIDETYSIVYFGGAVDSSKALPIDLPPGGSFPAADISMGVGKTRAWHIRGSIMTRTLEELGPPAPGTARIGTFRPNVRQAGNVGAVRMPWGADATVLSVSSAADGTFDLAGAVPGHYRVWVNTPVGGTVAYIDVDNHDVDNVKMLVSPGTQFPGKVMVEGAPAGVPNPELARIRVTLKADINLRTGGLEATGAIVGADGNFRFAGSRNARVFVDGLPPNTYVKALRMDGHDILSSGSYSEEAGPMEIVLGVDVGSVAGTVADGKGIPVPNIPVVLIPDSIDLRMRSDLIRSTSTDSKGRFRIQAIPAGNYRLYSWELVEPGAWLDPEFMRSFETRGKPIQIIQNIPKEAFELTAIQAR